MRRDDKNRSLDVDNYPESSEWNAIIDSLEGFQRRITLTFVVKDEEEDMSAGTYPGGVYTGEAQHFYLMNVFWRPESDQYYVLLEDILGTSEYACTIERISIEDVGEDPLKKNVMMTIVAGEVFT